MSENSSSSSCCCCVRKSFSFSRSPLRSRGRRIFQGHYARNAGRQRGVLGTRDARRHSQRGHGGSLSMLRFWFGKWSGHAWPTCCPCRPYLFMVMQMIADGRCAGWLLSVIHFCRLETSRKLKCLDHNSAQPRLWWKTLILQLQYSWIMCSGRFGFIQLSIQ